MATIFEVVLGLVLDNLRDCAQIHLIIALNIIINFVFENDHENFSNSMTLYTHRIIKTMIWIS